MTRGGKRAGAGRRPGSTILTWDQRLVLGGQCEHLWRDACAARLKAAEASLFARSDYREQIAALQTVPLDERASYSPRHAPHDPEDDDGDEEGATDLEYATYAAEAHADDIEGARKLMAGMSIDDPTPAPRLFEIRAARPYGVTRAIVKEAAAWASAQFHKPVSPRMAKTCWDAFRLLREETTPGD